MGENPDLVIGVNAILSFLNMGLGRFYRLRRKYAKTIPCPIFVEYGLLKGRRHIRKIHSTKELLLQWKWQVLQAEAEEHYRKRGKKYEHF